MNRNRKFHFLHDYYIVIDPIANDGVVYLLGLYEEGTLSIYELSKELTYKKLNRQYYFGIEYHSSPEDYSEYLNRIV